MTNQQLIGLNFVQSLKNPTGHSTPECDFIGLLRENFNYHYQNHEILVQSNKIYKDHSLNQSKYVSMTDHQLLCSNSVQSSRTPLCALLSNRLTQAYRRKIQVIFSKIIRLQTKVIKFGGMIVETRSNIMLWPKGSCLV